MNSYFKILIFGLFLLNGCEDDKESSSTDNNGGNGQGETVYGCTDPDATNYNPDATEDDGSCEYGSANVIVGISFSSGDCSSCNTSDGGEGLRGVCNNCYQIVLDYSVQNAGGGNANNVQIRFKVEYTPVSNITGAQTNWYSDVLNLNDINSGEVVTGSIVAADYNYYDGTSLTSYTNVRVYLNSLVYSD